MENISWAVSMYATDCCFAAIGNLCHSYLGSSDARTTGRKRSILLLILGAASALWFQHKLGPAIVLSTGWIGHVVGSLPGVGATTVHENWNEPCQRYDFGESKLHHKNENDHLLQLCAEHAGVYRPLTVASIFFLVAAVAAKLNPTVNREAWLSKYACFLMLVVGSLFVSSAPFLSDPFLWFSRICATLFVVLQQIILIDIAYFWNENWVDRSDRADQIGEGDGIVWLRAIIAVCLAFYSLVFGGLYLMYRFFDCPESTWIITFTLWGVVLLTLVQLLGTEGSLLTSSVMSLYATSLTYSVLSKNPNNLCNPLLGKSDSVGTAVDLTLTIISLAWLGWNPTEKYQSCPEGMGSSDDVSLDVPFLDPANRPTTGIVTGQQDSNEGSNNIANEELWKTNVALALMSSWLAMAMTKWGSLEHMDEVGTSLANTQANQVSMIMLAISQWLAIALYIWTLVAPKLFPDRDFS